MYVHARHRFLVMFFNLFVPRLQIYRTGNACSCCQCVFLATRLNQLVFVGEIFKPWSKREFKDGEEMKLGTSGLTL